MDPDHYQGNIYNRYNILNVVKLIISISSMVGGELGDDVFVPADEFDNGFVVPKHSRLTQRFHTAFLQISSPVRMWIFFTLCNFLNYIDRGAFAGSLTAIDDDFDLTSSQMGMLGGTECFLFFVFFSKRLLILIIYSILYDGIYVIRTSFRTFIKKISTGCTDVYRFSHLVFGNTGNRYDAKDYSKNVLKVPD